MTPISPRIVDEAITAVRALHQVGVGGHQFNEGWLQELLFRRPDLLPAAEIDPAFARLVPLAREFPVTSGSIDVLYANADGGLCLVETKLWRNPEAHRTVLAQLLDYAKDLSQLDYPAFKAKVESVAPRYGYPPNLDRIMAGRAGAANFDSIQFEHGVRRSLATGAFLLLIVGDRIRPEVAMLSGILGTAPHLEFSLALIEMNFYHLDAGEKWPVLVMPVIVGKSHELTRAVVRIRYEEKRPEVEVVAAEETPSSTGRTSLEVFIKSVPSGLDDIYRAYLERWMAGPLIVSWGTVGFSLRTTIGGKLKTIIDAYPTYSSVVTEKRLPQLGNPTEAYREYRTALRDVPAVQAVFSKNGTYFYFDKMTLEQAQTFQAFLEATDRFAQALVGSSGLAND